MAFTKITAAGIGSTETVTIDGLSVINDASFNGNVSVGGTLTYEDVTNIDSVGLITARAGVVVGSGITLSKDGDGFYTGVVTATTFSGNFTGGTFTGDGSSLTGVASTDNIRTNTNATFLQNVNVVGTGTFGSHVSLGDSDELRFGAGTDLKMYHDGFDSRIHNITGNFLIRNEASSGNIFLRTKTSESAIDCVPDGAVNLYYDGAKKLETASGGVTVTGTVAATSYTGDGSALTGIGGTANVRTGILDVAGIATFRNDVNVPNINGGQIGGIRNLAINGAFMVAQRGTSSTASSGYHTVDRWSQDYGGVDEAPTFSIFDVSAPSSPYHLPTSGDHPYKEGFRKAWGVTNGNQTSGAGADDNIIMGYAFEGQDIVNSGWNYLSSSSYATLSFWIKSSVSQEFFGQLIAPNGTAYNYPFGTGSLTAFTWTKVVKTIPGNSNITIPNSNAGGLRFYLWPFAGTNLTGSVTNDAWQVNNYSTRVSDNTTTWYLTNDASVQITGFQLEAGAQATPFEHRSYGEELGRCMRYFEGVYMNDGTASMKSYGSYGGSSNFEYQMKVEKRSRPTFSLEGDAGWSGATPNAYESKSSVAFQVNGGTLFSLGDGTDDLSASFDAEI